MLITKWLLALLVLVFISACAPVSTLPSDNDSAQLKHPRMVIDVRNRTTLPNIVSELARHQVVLVGESHTNYSHHQNQLAVIKALHQYWPKMGIGIEFVQRPFQSVLDEYVAGNINDVQLLRKTEWYQRWSYDFRLYRPIFHYAKAKQIPLFALNAPVELTQKISKSGIAGLQPQDRQHLPKHITRNKAYRERLQKVYQQHSSKHNKGNKGLDRFVDVQLAWDESMAHHAAKAIQSGKINHMVLLAGSGHVVRQGIPVRLTKHLGTQPAIIVNELPENLAEIDYVLIANDDSLPATGKIGVFMEPAKKGVRVSGILKSHKAGLQKGDLILSIDGQETAKPEDVKIILLDKTPNEMIQIKIQRVESGRAQRIFEKQIKLL